MQYLGFVEGRTSCRHWRQPASCLSRADKIHGPSLRSKLSTAGRPVVLGPGVYSARDLEAVAGNSITQLSALDGTSLPWRHAEPECKWFRWARERLFSPSLIATRFLSILDGAAPRG